MDEGSIVRLEPPPTEAAGWSVTRVEPNVAPVNITLAGYFGPVLPPRVFLLGTKARAPRSAERARAEQARRAPLLAEGATKA